MTKGASAATLGMEFPPFTASILAVPHPCSSLRAYQRAPQSVRKSWSITGFSLLTKKCSRANLRSGAMLDVERDRPPMVTKTDQFITQMKLRELREQRTRLLNTYD